MSNSPKCPFCKSDNTCIAGARTYYCRDCDRLFDSDPNEGGDYSDFNAAVRLEREERAAARRAQNRRRA